ncbi:MAG TPA: histidinol dehydrogenase [Terriglobales bacterium]|nr:histidinol dehydrogenase [Terriglobales bacterium]
MRILEGRRAEETVRRLASRGAADLSRVEPVVRKIVTEVRRGGDRKLRAYAEKFDGLGKGQALEVSREEINAAWQGVSAEFQAALKQSARNIRRYCQWQMPKSWTRQMQPGLRVGQLAKPLERVGCYVPGGRYPLPSTLLMTVIPAQVAGVQEITVVSPKPARETLAAAALLGVERVFRIGGAQAIAALAYGTESVAKVDKIVGPGNLYVTAAKKLVAWDCAIDMLAGPTEVVLVSDDGTPQFLAADLVAQAEHDPDASAVFITTNRELAKRVVEEVKPQSRGNAVARQSLKANGTVILASSREQALQFANAIAPEHLTVSGDDLQLVQNAGAVFVGEYSPQSMGDYASGPNHVLPTGAAARYRGGLSVLDFVKIISVQECTPAGLDEIAPCVTTLADAEGLKAHAESVRMRCRAESVRVRRSARSSGEVRTANA